VRKGWKPISSLRFDLIASQPRIGFRRPDLSGRPYRFWLKQGYWIVYRLQGARPPPVIVALIDARRDVARLLR
jgi:plasmid stabilization system protein ParE